MASDASIHALKYQMIFNLGILTPMISSGVAVHLDICFWFPKYINSVFALFIFNYTASIKDLTLSMQSSITVVVSSSSSWLFGSE